MAEKAFLCAVLISHEHTDEGFFLSSPKHIDSVWSEITGRVETFYHLIVFHFSQIVDDSISSEHTTSIQFLYQRGFGYNSTLQNASQRGDSLHCCCIGLHRTAQVYLIIWHLSVCSSTFGAVGGVVQGWRVAQVVWWNLQRRAPDPVKAIAEGELIPATGTPLKVTLSGWEMGKYKKRLFTYDFLDNGCNLNDGERKQKSYGNSLYISLQPLRFRLDE